MRQQTLTTLRLPLALLFTGLLSTTALAGDSHHETRIVKVKTGDAEAVEADVSDLALGESRTYTTDSGSTVDILRVPEGLEVYVDGELLSAEFGAENLHERMALIHEAMELECDPDADGACEDHYAYAWSSGHDLDADVFVDREKIEIVCDEAEDCDEMVWIDADADAEGLHEAGQHRIVIIERKEITREE